MRALWQIFIAILILGTLFSLAESVLHSQNNGDFGFRSHSAGQGEQVVDSVTPGSKAEKAGLRANDRLYGGSFRQRTFQRATRTGDSITMSVGRPQAGTITLLADAAAPQLPLVIVVILTIVFYDTIAALVAWRRPEDPAARTLATFLACLGAGISVNPPSFSEPWMRVVSFALAELLFLVAAVEALAFTCRFPVPAQSGWRRTVLRTSPAIVLVGIAISWTRLTLVLWADEPTASRPLLIAYILLYVAILLTALISLIGSYRSASGAQRARIMWVLLTFATGFSGVIANLAGIGAGFIPDWLQYLPLTIVFIPIGLAYVILRHRIIDIGFVVNRAIVYAGVSAVVVGTFVIFEWLLGHLVEQHSKASTFLQLAAALALGLSTQYIHKRVDRYVDDLFFRERHRADAAIRHFAHEALFITTVDDLITKTVEVAQRNAHLSTVAFYVSRGSEYASVHATVETPPPVDENDYAVLDMRAWHQPVDLHVTPSHIRGEVAFPMMVRGTLIGFLACGEKTTREAIAPDEREALALLARDTGIALDSLRVRLIERELAALASEAELPPEVRTRLQSLTATGGEGFAF